MIPHCKNIYWHREWWKGWQFRIERIVNQEWKQHKLRNEIGISWLEEHLVLWSQKNSCTHHNKCYLFLSRKIYIYNHYSSDVCYFVKTMKIDTFQNTIHHIVIYTCKQRRLHLFTEKLKLCKNIMKAVMHSIPNENLLFFSQWTRIVVLKTVLIFIVSLMNRSSTHGIKTSHNQIKSEMNEGWHDSVVGGIVYWYRQYLILLMVLIACPYSYIGISCNFTHENNVIFKNDDLELKHV